GVSSVSDQGIDNDGNAMVDYLTTAGTAFEFHDQGSSVQLPISSVVQAKAGQGVSYVLVGDPSSGNTSVYEYCDPGSEYPSGQWYGPWTTGTGSRSEWSDLLGWIDVTQYVVQIDAGTDKFGVNAVAMLDSFADAYLRSDTDGLHLVASNIAQISGGQQGLVALLTAGTGWGTSAWGTQVAPTSPSAWYYNEWSPNQLTYLTGGQVQTGLFPPPGPGHVATGYDATGNWVIFVDNRMYRPASNTWTNLGGSPT